MAIPQNVLDAISIWEIEHTCVLCGNVGIHVCPVCTKVAPTCEHRCDICVVTGAGLDLETQFNQDQDSQRDGEFLSEQEAERRMDEAASGYRYFLAFS